MDGSSSSTEGGRSQQIDSTEVEEIARIVLQTIENQQAQEQEEKKMGVSRLFDWIFSRGVTIPVLLSVLLILGGLIYFDIPPWRVLQGAVDSYRQAVLKDALINRHLEAGNAFLNLGRPGAAKIEYEQALKLDPTDAWIQLSVRKAELFTQIREGTDYDRAAMYEKIAQLSKLDLNDYNDDPSQEEQKLYDVHMSHMRVFEGDLLASYRPDRAEELYNEAISLNDKNSYAFFALGVLYDGQNKPEMALEKFEEAYEMKPYNSEYHSNYAYALYENKSYEKAEEEYLDVNLWDPYFLTTYFDLSKVYLVQGKIYEANFYQERLIELLEDERVTSLEKNRATIYYATPPSPYPVYLPGLAEKKYYAYYSVALTAYLLGKEDNATGYVNQTGDVSMDDLAKSEIKRLVEHDIETLKEEQGGRLATKAEKFKQQFL
jgi:tetratricopeptide (TPR) repeat protein